MKHILNILFILLFSSCVAQVDGQWPDPYENPQIVGGIDSLFQSIEPETQLPKCCENPGKVFIQMTITKTGHLKESQVIRGLCPKADSISLKIVRKLKFLPAKKNGSPYEASFILPISFWLKK
ncbi:MAG: energy transducer TonB [Bacteroidota bacterium]